MDQTEEISNTPQSSGGLLTKMRVSSSKHYTRQFGLDELLEAFPSAVMEFAPVCYDGCEFGFLGREL